MKLHDILISLKKTNEVTLLHELSNKFNLLSLALEDLEEVIEESLSGEALTPQLKDQLKDDWESVSKARSKYLNTLQEFKGGYSPGLKCSFEDGLQQALATYQKDLAKAGVKVSFIPPKKEEDREALALSLFLDILLGFALLRSENPTGLNVDLSSADAFNETLDLIKEKHTKVLLKDLYQEVFL